MTANAIVSQIVAWLRTIAAILILAAIGLAVAKILFPSTTSLWPTSPGPTG